MEEKEYAVSIKEVEIPYDIGGIVLHIKIKLMNIIGNCRELKGLGYVK